MTNTPRSEIVARYKPWLAEIAVIVVGILLAFQVEEWREQRGERRDVATALDRLREESAQNLEACEFSVPMIGDNVRAMEHVFRSLEAGEYIDDNKELFDFGLVVFDVVPDIRMSTTVANEMLATGLLKEVDDRELRGLLAWMPSLESESQDSLNYWREFILELFSEIISFVDYSYEGQAVDLNAASFDFDAEPEEWAEYRMSVQYDLAELSANRRLRNLFFEAVDVHGDLYGDVNRRCGVMKSIHTILIDTPVDP